MATRAELMQAIREADAAGDTDAAARFAQMYNEAPQELSMDERMKRAGIKPVDPTEGMSPLELAVAGAGQSAESTIRGARQLWNMATGDDEEVARLEEEENERRRLDAPLLNTGAGRAGQIGGHILQAAMPIGMGVKAAGAVGLSAKALAKAAAISGATGATAGALQPVAGKGERTGNIVTGGVAGALIPGATLAIPAIKFGRHLPVVRGVVDKVVEHGRNKVKAVAGKRIDEITTPLRIPAEKLVAELRNVKRAYGDDLPASFSKFADEVANVAQNKGKMLGLKLQDARSAISKEAEKLGGGLSTGLNRAKRAIDKAFDDSLPEAEAVALRRARVEAATGQSQKPRSAALRATGKAVGALPTVGGVVLQGTAAPLRRPGYVERKKEK